MTVPGLSAADSAAYTRALNSDCEIRLQVMQLTLSHGLISSVSDMVIDGQINLTAGDGENVTRTLQMGFLDPDHTLNLDSGAPTAGFGGLNRLIRVNTYVTTPELGRWIMAPAFTGRPSSIARDGDTVSIEAQGKECLHLRDVDAFPVNKRANTVNAIRYILAKGGETRFRFPTGFKHQLPAKIIVGGQNSDRQPWKVAFRLARSLNLQLYYDSYGYACLRRYPTTTAWDLVEQGENANLLSTVKVTTDLTTIRNRVIVFGQTKATKSTKGHPGKKAQRVIGRAVAAVNNANSAQNLAVNGTSWFNTAFFDESASIHTQKDADALAKTRLTSLLTEAIDVETTTLPVWHLEPMDVMRLRTRSADFTFRLKDASIPLGPADGGMTIGYRASVRNAKAGRIRRKR